MSKGEERTLFGRCIGWKSGPDGRCSRKCPAATWRGGEDKWIECQIVPLTLAEEDPCLVRRMRVALARGVSTELFLDDGVDRDDEATEEEIHSFNVGLTVKEDGKERTFRLEHLRETSPTLAFLAATKRLRSGTTILNACIEGPGSKALNLPMMVEEFNNRNKGRTVEAVKVEHTLAPRDEEEIAADNKIADALDTLQRISADKDNLIKLLISDIFDAGTPTISDFTKAEIEQFGFRLPERYSRFIKSKVEFKEETVKESERGSRRMTRLNLNPEPSERANMGIIFAFNEKVEVFFRPMDPSLTLDKVAVIKETLERKFRSVIPGFDRP